MDVQFDLSEQGDRPVIGVGGEVGVSSGPPRRERLASIDEVGHGRVVVNLDGVR